MHKYCNPKVESKDINFHLLHQALSPFPDIFPIFLKWYLPVDSCLFFDTCLLNQFINALPLLIKPAVSLLKNHLLQASSFSHLLLFSYLLHMKTAQVSEHCGGVHVHDHQCPGHGLRLSSGIPVPRIRFRVCENHSSGLPRTG